MQELKRPRGRPATGRERNAHLGIRVTDEEKKLIKETAIKNNLTVQQLILKRCIDK